MKKSYKISLKVYSEDKIKQAISDVSGDVQIELSSENIIVYGENEQEIENIFQEFMNYVLFI